MCLLHTSVFNHCFYFNELFTQYTSSVRFIKVSLSTCPTSCPLSCYLICLQAIMTTTMHCMSCQVISTTIIHFQSSHVWCVWGCLLVFACVRRMFYRWTLTHLWSQFVRQLSLVQLWDWKKRTGHQLNEQSLLMASLRCKYLLHTACYYKVFVVVMSDVRSVTVHILLLLVFAELLGLLLYTYL